MSSTSVHVGGMQLSVATLAMAFIAGVLAVPVFHQILLLVFHLAGIVPFAPFDMTPTKPFGVPAVISISFWGGVWGVIFALTLPRWFSGASYWIAAVIAGGVALTLVFMFVVWPLKVGGLPPNMGGLFVIGFLLNAAWGIGWALFLALFERLRGSGGIAAPSRRLPAARRAAGSLRITSCRSRAAAQHLQPQRKRNAQPERKARVILVVVAGQRVHQDTELAAVQHQPRQEARQLVDGEGHLIH